MASQSQKPAPPPYVSFTSFKNFIIGLGETGVPGRIDHSVMSKFSGSVRYALLPALQWLGLIDNDGMPQQSIRDLSGADENEFPNVLQNLLKDRYSFLFTNGLDLSNASSAQVQEAFKQAGCQGSTVTKAMMFFIGAAKAANIKLGPHVKAPTQPRRPKKKDAKPDGSKVDKGSNLDDVKEPLLPKDMEAIRISVHGQDDWTIWVPANLTYAQWKHGLKVAMFNLEHYRPPEED